MKDSLLINKYIHMFVPNCLPIVLIEIGLLIAL